MVHRIRQVPVVVTVQESGQPPRTDFVIVPKLVGEDSYLTGTLSVSSVDLKVRILTLDNRTVLVPAGWHDPLPAALTDGIRIEALLTLRSPCNAPPLPDDLDRALHACGLKIASADPRQQAYLLAFLAEARDTSIRQGRIDLICDSLAATGDGL